MSKIELVVIGASAGGLDGLLTIAKHLPESLPATVLVVMHTNNSGTTYLPEILGRVSRLPVELAADGQVIGGGRILIAPPDFHVALTGRTLSLTKGPRENGFRPAIDPLFRSAARAYGPRLMGVILSGALDDGAYGMRVIAEHGGVTVVQDPEEAQVPSMPLSTLSNVKVDHVLKASAIGAMIEEYTQRNRARKAMVMKKTVMNKTVMKQRRRPEPEPQDQDGTPVEEMIATYGAPSALTCPDCGGALWEVSSTGVLRFRCHVGHQYSGDALDSRTHDTVEGALWKALRVLEEQSAMKHRMAERAKGAGLSEVRKGFLAGATDSRRQAEAIRDLLFGRKVVAPGEAMVANVRSRTKTRPARARRATGTTARRRRVS